MQKNSLLQYTILLIVSFIAVRSCITEKEENANLKESVAVLSNDSSEYFRNRYEREHLRTQLLQAYIADTGIADGNLLDSIIHMLDTLNAGLHMVFISPATKNKVMVPADTSGQENKKIAPGNNVYNHILPDTDALQYEPDNFIVNTYRKHIGFLKDATCISIQPLYQNGRLSDPYLFSIPDDHKRFGIGPYIGLGFNGERLQPSIGISIHYSLLRF
jgi:hypothetical protein